MIASGGSGVHEEGWNRKLLFLIYLLLFDLLSITGITLIKKIKAILKS